MAAEADGRVEVRKEVEVRLEQIRGTWAQNYEKRWRVMVGKEAIFESGSKAEAMRLLRDWRAAEQGVEGQVVAEPMMEGETI